jgi:N-acetylglutamate synthase-like GNAT family acetyltransferase
MQAVRERTKGRVRCRRATLDDADAVRAMVLRCSATSLYARFLTVVVPDTAASMLAASLGSEAPTWLAEVEGTVVGIGGTYQFDDGTAEIALLVEDRWQRHGVATALLPHLVAEARTRRAPHIWATALGEGIPAIRKLARGVGGSIQVSLSGGIAEVTAALRPPEITR